ncbi:hypothetical protein Q0F99_10460 [Rathayibacter oskolensis]|uniref:DeoR/GlpR family DNA-binding transcription regulator n=1 Tax=Rathayibacter oskolensis TaxID=1891671 RepID=UPI00265DCD64|nr:hypothetical protein [Rathayibacter oskolensis]WKK70320.1 hypothetical protein Q0F99_10460 [Rathayibacter oskolensis]
MIAPGDSVLIDNGTTALAVAEELSGLGITAMALSLHAAAALARTPGNEVIVPGGPVGHDDLAFTGAGAAEAIRAMRFDIAILGACAADPETGLTVASWGDAQVKRAAIESSRRVLLVATPEKFTRTAAHRFGSFRDLDTIVTLPDILPPSPAKREKRESMSSRPPPSRPPQRPVERRVLLAASCTECSHSRAEHLAGAGSSGGTACSECASGLGHGYSARPVRHRPVPTDRLPTEDDGG